MAVSAEEVVAEAAVAVSDEVAVAVDSVAVEVEAVDTGVEAADTEVVEVVGVGTVTEAVEEEDRALEEAEVEGGRTCNVKFNEDNRIYVIYFSFTNKLQEFCIFCKWYNNAFYIKVILTIFLKFEYNFYVPLIVRFHKIS